MNRKTSKIWTVEKEELQQIVFDCTTRSDVLRALGLSTNGASNHARLKSRLEEDGIDCSTLVGTTRGKWLTNRIPTEEILVENSTYLNRGNIKKRLIDEGLLEYKCNRCGLEEWLGFPISLQLHHKNGISNDHRLVNLELLCPNCHSLTDTFAGKNIVCTLQ